MLAIDLRDDTPGVPVRRCACGALLCTPRRCPTCAKVASKAGLTPAASRALRLIETTPGLSYQQICSQLGLGEQTTWSLLQRIACLRLAGVGHDGLWRAM